MTQYIYLLQKREFIKTKEPIYKIGKTKQENLKRICNYDKGSILICQFKCNDSDKLEKKLITLFREKYELQKDIGNEYFEGNWHDMRDDIYYEIKNENIIEDIENEEEIEPDVPIVDKNTKKVTPPVEDEDEDEDEEEEEEDEEENEEESNEIKEIFPNYKDDESFGGTKKLIKISFEDKTFYNRIYNRIYTYYINDEKEIDHNFLQRNWFQKDDYDNSDYISKLLKNNVIQDGMIYDFNDSSFIKKLNKHKDKINITYTDENIIDMISKFKTLDQNNIIFKIYRMLYNNCLLHKEIYCDYINDTLHIDFMLPYDNFEKQINVIKFNNITYDYLFLRKYTPYCIELKDDKYYFYNKNYQIIDKNEIKYSIENWNGKRIYFDGEIGLIFNKDKNKFKNYIEKINNHISKSNMICMNMNENTQIILNMIK